MCSRILAASHDRSAACSGDGDRTPSLDGTVAAGFLRSGDDGVCGRQRAADRDCWSAWTAGGGCPYMARGGSSFGWDWGVRFGIRSYVSSFWEYGVQPAFLAAAWASAVG